MLKINHKLLMLLLLSLLLTLGTGAKAKELEDWNYYKKISSQGQQNYKAFFLDADIYRYAQQDFSDLRIVDQSGQFLPYYIKDGYKMSSKKELSYSAERISSFQKKQDSYFDFKVHKSEENKDILGDTIKLTVSHNSYLKQGILYGSYGGQKWTKVTDFKIYQINGLTKNKISLPQTQKYQYYRIKLADNIEEISVADIQLLYTIKEENKFNFTAQEEIDYSLDSNDDSTTIKLNNANQFRIKEIKLDSLENYKRQYMVYRKTNNNKYTIKQGDIYNLQFEKIKINNQRISFAERPIADDKIYIKIIDDDDQPLKIENITISYYRHQLIFEANDNPPYRIYFGFKQAVNPNYDLKSYQEYISPSELGLANLGQLQQIKKKPTEPVQSKPKLKLEYIFNGVILFISLLLIIFLLKKLHLVEKD